MCVFSRKIAVGFAICITYAFAGQNDKQWYNFESIFNIKIDGSKKKSIKLANKKQIINFDALWDAAVSFASKHSLDYSNKSRGVVRCNKSPAPIKDTTMSITIEQDSKDSFDIIVKIYCDSNPEIDFSAYEAKAVEEICSAAKLTETKSN